MTLAGFATYQIAASTSSGVQALSTPIGGHTPKGVIVELSGDTTAGSAAANHMRLGFGMSDGSTTRAFSVRSEDNVSTSGVGHRRSQALVNFSNAGSNAQNANGDFDSFDVDEVNIDWTDPPAAAFLMDVTVFFGDLLSCAVRQKTVTTPLNSESTISGLSFAPNLVFGMARHGGYPASPSGGNQAWISSGMAILRETGSIEQLSYSYGERDNLSIQTGMGRIAHNNRILRIVEVGGTGSPTFDEGVELTSFNSDGIGLTLRDSAVNLIGAFMLVDMSANRLLLSAKNLQTATSGTAAAKKITTGWPVESGRFIGTNVSV